MTKIDPGKVPQRKLFTGALMPAVGMGTFGSDHVSAQEVSQAVAGAIEAGYRSFDCAACYGNEAQIGQVFAYCKEQGIEPVGFCPIGSPSRPERDKTPEDITDIELPEIRAIAQAHGVHPAVICIKWAVQRGQTPIPFSTKEKNYTANLRCVTEDPLTEEEMDIISGLDRNNRLIKGQVFLWEGASGWEELWDMDVK
ncbi:MAG: aldo/keto reductase [Lachnospiraceae bacterium]